MTTASQRIAARRTPRQLSLFDQPRGHGDEKHHQPALPPARRVQRNRLANLLALAVFTDLTAAEQSEIDTAIATRGRA